MHQKRCCPKIWHHPSASEVCGYVRHACSTPESLMRCGSCPYAAYATLFQNQNRYPAAPATEYGAEHAIGITDPPIRSNGNGLAEPCQTSVLLSLPKIQSWALSANTAAILSGYPSLIAVSSGFQIAPSGARFDTNSCLESTWLTMK